MAIEFEFYETPDPSGKKETTYHARAVTHNTVSTNKIIEEIAMASTLTPGDVKAALSLLSDMIAQHLENSERVHLQGIGYFQPTLQCNKEVEPDKTRAQSVSFKAVKFRADQELNNKLKYAATRRAKFKTHSAKLTDKEVDKKVAAFFAQNSYLNRKQFQALCGMTVFMASKHIKRLLEEGKIKNIHTRTHPVYVLEGSMLF